MAYDFPRAYDAHMQLLYDRRDTKQDSRDVLEAKITKLVSELPVKVSTPAEILEHEYKKLRLLTLLYAKNPNGIFKSKVPYDAALQRELEDKGWFVRVDEAYENMEISSLSF